MSDTDRWTEPGRHVSQDGRIVYAWPPEGRFTELWARMEAALPTDDDKLDALALLQCWRDDNATLVAYEDPVTGEWVDVEWPWTEAGDG